MKTISIDSDHLLPSQRCPYCGHTVNRAGGGEERPGEGDVTVCISCAEPSMVGPGQLLVKFDLGICTEEQQEEVRVLQTLCRMVKRKR